MKKRIASILLVSMLCLSLLPVVALADKTANTGEVLGQMPSYSGGSGTKDDPWLIASVADLQTLATTINSGAAAAFDADCTDTGKGIPGNYHGYYFKQTADLDLSSIDNWAPIGSLILPVITMVANTPLRMQKVQARLMIRDLPQPVFSVG